MNYHNHSFGGKWTEQKLDILEKYLRAWLSIFNGNENAKYFRTVYLDAFAGTGYRSVSSNSEEELFDSVTEEESEQFMEGSSLRAIHLDPKFDEIILVDRKRKHVQSLKDFQKQDPRVRVVKDDANHFITEWVKSVNWKKTRAVLFLDPYGLQVDWKTLELVAQTKAIDLWLLFPLGNGIIRMLKRGELPSLPWQRKITKFLGTEDWKNEFYQTTEEEGLFGMIKSTEKTATPETIKRYFVKRLETIFPAVAPNPVELRNSVNNPMFLFCFACSNPKPSVKKAALRIANDILKHF